jgi:DNA-binding LacI/PurR family transcriptional regulator
MLYIGSSVHDEYLLEFDQTPYPFMLVNHYFPKSSLCCIMADYPASARIAGEHLVKLGHRNIGVIAGTNTHTATDFTNGFTEYCASQGIRKEDLPWADGWFTEQGGYEAAQWLHERHPKITAIMAGNDKMAIGAMRFLATKNIKIPGDISVVGVDDIPAAQFTTPQLTTVRHDLYRIGRLAVDGLLALFRKEIDSCHKILPVNLVVRESTGPAKPRP